MKNLILIVIVCLFSSVLTGQNVKKDRGYLGKPDNGYYYNVIMKSLQQTAKNKDNTAEKKFKMDVSGLYFPDSLKNYKYAKHNKPVSQGNSGLCWSYAATSMFESEIYRLNNIEVKLSEMYTVYWEYVEKARRFVEERGNSFFSQGSEVNAVKRIYQKYGIVPYEAYTGIPNGQEFNDHSRMFMEMKSYLESVKNTDAWNEEVVISVIKSILNHHIGEPPLEFTWSKDNKKYTPVTFLNKALKLKIEDYVDIISYMQESYYKRVEYKVPDNWWHSEDYYNVPLDIFTDALFDAISREGFTCAISGDVSEPGFVKSKQVAIVPTFDIPSGFIDENARQLRFSNHTTTDDHAMHLVGYSQRSDGYWFLVKDSGSGSRNNDPDRPEFGYYFMHQDYIKLKMMTFFVHKDAVSDILKKFASR